MKLDELKSGWQNAGGRLRSEEELQQMTKVFNHPSVKKIRIKLIIETIFLLLFLVVYYDWFDGDKKPLYANLALISGLVLYILNDVVGYWAVREPVGEDNLKRSVQIFLARVKRLSVFSITLTLLYSVSIMIFFTSIIHFTKEKALTLVFGIVIVFQLVILSSKIWRGWIKNLKKQMQDFNMDE